MSTTTTPPVRDSAGPRITFAGIIRSEWIKLRSLRSSVWCYAIIVLITLAVGMLLATTFTSGAMGGADTTQLALQVVTISLPMSVLVSAVLGALVITGEYGTGMIRSTFTAVPKRIPALVAKALVFGVTTFIVGLVALVGTALATLPILAGSGIDVVLSPEYLLALVGGAGYLALMGVLSLAIGAIIRSSAGGIAASLGLILVVPTIVGVIGFITQTPWITEFGKYLPSNAGAVMYQLPAAGAALDPMTGAAGLDPAQGALVVVAWVVAGLVGAALLVRSRDA